MKTMLKRTIAVLLGVAIAGIMTVVGSGTAYACSCMQQSLTDQVSSADIVFTGTAKSSDGSQNPTSSADPVRWTFAVDGVQKGNVTRTFDVVSALDSASCGIPFAIDQRYLVVGYLDGATMTANLCGGTVAVDELPAGALASLGTGTAPVADTPTAPTPEPAASVETSRDSWAGPMVVIIGLGVAVILGAATVVVWRRLRRDH
ncbi:hypothetical protein ACVBEQ_02070 [Nakamurella sp. GG22]